MLKLNRKHFLTALCLVPALSWAQSSNTVVMYTSAPTEIQNALVPAIKAKLGLDVQLVSAGGGELGFGRVGDARRAIGQAGPSLLHRPENPLCITRRAPRHVPQFGRKTIA